MSRRLLVAFSLSLIVLLSACTTQMSGSLTTLPTGDARTTSVRDAAAPDRQLMTQNLDTVTLVTTLAAENAAISAPLTGGEAMAQSQDTITLVTTLDFEHQSPWSLR